MYGKSRVEV